MAQAQKTTIDNVISLYGKPTSKIECIDNLEFMRSLKKESMHLIVTSPPYNIGKEYERKRTSLELYIEEQAAAIAEAVRLLHPNGSICWLNGQYEELKYIQETTGKQPAIRGMDFIDSSRNENEVRFAEEWWKKGGIPTMMWHWGAPAIGNGYINSKKTIDIDKCFEKGTPEYKAFWKELEEKGQLLKKLDRAHIPILWRPFHEMNGNWFWWSKGGPERFKRLWITMYDYYVHKLKLNNLVWVLCYTNHPDSAWYPGRAYVDIAGADDYSYGGTHAQMYKNAVAVVGSVMPVPFHECPVPPDPAQSFADGARWSWFMVWHSNFLKKIDPKYLKYVYNSDLVITLDKVPDIMAVYGGK